MSARSSEAIAEWWQEFSTADDLRRQDLLDQVRDEQKPAAPHAGAGAPAGRRGRSAAVGAGPAAARRRCASPARATKPTRPATRVARPCRPTARRLPASAGGGASRVAAAARAAPRVRRAHRRRAAAVTTHDPGLHRARRQSGRCACRVLLAMEALDGLPGTPCHGALLALSQRAGRCHGTDFLNAVVALDTMLAAEACWPSCSAWNGPRAAAAVPQRAAHARSRPAEPWRGGAATPTI